MKTYVCDSCHIPIADPHFVKMKEFCLGWDYDTVIVQTPITVKYKIHLCDECFKGLKEIGKRSSEK